VVEVRQVATYNLLTHSYASAYTVCNLNLLTCHDVHKVSISGVDFTADSHTTVAQSY